MIIDTASLLAYFERGSYLAYFILLALGGYVIPIPEEVLLLTVGYAVAAGIGRLDVTVAVAVVSILTSDFVVFLLSRHGGRVVTWLKKRVSERQISRYEELMKFHVGKTIFLARFTIGLRFLSVVLAGSFRVPKRVFLWYDFLALIIYTPLLIFLGYRFHQQFVAVLSTAKVIRHLFTLAVFVLIALLVTYLAHRRLKKITGPTVPPEPEEDV